MLGQQWLKAASAIISNQKDQGERVAMNSAIYDKANNDWQ